MYIYKYSSYTIKPYLFNDIKYMFLLTYIFFVEKNDKS